MWILPTRGRPQNLIRFFEAYRKTKADSPGLVIADDDDKSDYESIELPKEWTLCRFPRMSVCKIFNKVFDDFPNAQWYGTLSDDVVPETDHWDKQLIQAAGSDCVANSNDGLRDGSVPTTAVIGGDFARSLGHIFLREFNHLYADDYLAYMAKKREVYKYLPEVMVRHHHFSVGLAPHDETYKQRKTTGDYETWQAFLRKESKLYIICVNAGNYLGRGVEYVNTLYDMVVRNTDVSIHGKFVVFTDNTDNTDYHPNIEIRPLPGNLKGWWNKLYLFKKGLFPDGSRIVFFDLDTAIVGDIDDILGYSGEFATLRDFWRPEGLGPAVIAWKAGGIASQIWLAYEALLHPQEGGNGDQWFIERYGPKPEILQDLYPGKFYSYKTSCQYQIPKDARVVCFHGNPRPHQVKGNWVEHIWKVGGGLVSGWKVVGNVDDKTTLDNIRVNLELPYELLAGQYNVPTGTQLLIVGGGPSLKESLFTIGLMQKAGSIVWALNNTFRYLCENGIEPNAHIMLDARLDNIDFMPSSTSATLLYATQCHPRVFEKAAKTGAPVIMWCSAVSGILELLDEKKLKAAVISAGSSVGLKALGLAQMFGFKDVHLFGYDSSYRGDENHAYPQKLNNNERIVDITVNGKKFKCAPWMAMQTQEFQDCIHGFTKEDMQFTVHGDGLLPYVASLMV